MKGISKADIRTYMHNEICRLYNERHTNRDIVESLFVFAPWVGENNFIKKVEGKKSF